MPTKDTSEYQMTMLYADGFGGLKYPLPIAQISMDDDNMYCTYDISDNNTTITGNMKLKPMGRKKFKKLLMNMGYQRNEAECYCKAVALFKGKLSYSMAYLYFMVGLLAYDDLKGK